jgi:DNA-directed RNA polymerase subunit RPC12/RpoP
MKKEPYTEPPGYVQCKPVGQDMIRCHRCGWEGKRLYLDVNQEGIACPKCPQFRDMRASLSIMANK